MQKFYRRHLDELQRLVGDTEAFFRQHAIDPSLKLKVDLSIEELFVNMIRYNSHSRQPVEVRWTTVQGGLEVELTDRDADRFDPTEAVEVDTGRPLEQREAGGLGLYLVMKMADSIHYEYHDRISTITIRNQVGPRGV